MPSFDRLDDSLLSRADGRDLTPNPPRDASRTDPDAPPDPRRLQLHRNPPRRDVPYVPTDEPVVSAMLRFAGVTAADTVYDLGCGDGRIVIAAARHCGASGVGVDIDPLRIAESRENALKARVTDRVQFLCQSFFDTDLRPATVMMLYLLPSINAKLRPKLLEELRPGTRIVCNSFEIGEWQPDMRADVHHRTLRQYIVPAWVAGTWKCVADHAPVLGGEQSPGGRQQFTLQLHRKFQIITGTARVGRRRLDVANGRLLGHDFTFKLIDAGSRRPLGRFAGKVEGHHLRGTCQLDGLEGPTVPFGGVWKSEGV